MSDDIVTRLRALTEVGSWVALSEWDSVTKQAADEIERLRTMYVELLEAFTAIITKQRNKLRDDNE